MTLFNLNAYFINEVVMISPCCFVRREWTEPRLCKESWPGGCVVKLWLTTCRIRVQIRFPYLQFSGRVRAWQIESHPSTIWLPHHGCWPACNRFYKWSLRLNISKTIITEQWSVILFRQAITTVLYLLFLWQTPHFASSMPIPLMSNFFQ